MNAVIYARYSSDNQREESIDGQIRECTDYARRENIKIVGTYIDRALSARTADRPDFQRMIHDSEKRLFDAVIVWKLDRFSRDRYDSAFYKRQLRKNGVKLISATEAISDGPEGIILEALLEGMNEYYSAELSVKIKRGGVITYCVGIWLLAVANNYWYQLCKLLMGEKIWWFLLPLAFWGSIIGLAVADFDPLYKIHLEIGEGFIRANILIFLGVLALIAVLFLINRWLIGKLMYDEMNKVADTKVSHVSEYKFFDRFGEIGEYMRLELKMLTRNKVSRQQLISISILVIVFSLLISFSDVYQGAFQDFLIIYNFVIFGTMFLSMLMSFEGNYIDGLMSRKESIYTLLRAKYYIYSVAMLIPLLFMLPAVFTGKVPFLTCVAWMLFTIGAVFCCYFQLAVYNNRTIPMNEKMTNRNYLGTGKQNIISLVAFGVPVTIGLALKGMVGEMWMGIIILSIGLMFVVTSNWWIMNVYQRFMKRRYINMEGFRDSRQK